MLVESENMVLRTLHIVGILFGIMMLMLSIFFYRKGKLDYNSFVFWLIVWVGFIAGILSFERLRSFTERMSVRPFDFFVLLAVLFILLVLFLQNKAIKESQKSISDIVSEVAVREGKRK